jgi:hypothetical protein
MDEVHIQVNACVLVELTDMFALCPAASNFCWECEKLHGMRDWRFMWPMQRRQAKPIKLQPEQQCGHNSTTLTMPY